MSTTEPPIPAGLVLEPFRALRFADDPRSNESLAPPFGDIPAVELSALQRARLHSVARLTRPAGVGDSRYDAAAAQLRQWRADGTLSLDATAGLYAYEITPLDYPRVRGLLGAVRLAPASAGIVLPHEDTMAGPVADRLALLEATATDLEPILLLHDGGVAAAAAIDGALAGRLLLDTTTPDGTRHRMGTVTDAETLALIAGELLGRRAMIADGHHRYATYLAHQAHHWNDGAGAGPWDAGLAYLVDATRSGPEVLAIHRVLTTLPLATAIERASAAGRVRTLPSGSATSLLAASRELSDPRAARGDGPAFVLGAGADAVLLDRLDAGAIAGTMPCDKGQTWTMLDVAALHCYVIPVVLNLVDEARTVHSEANPDRALAAARRANGTAVLMRAASTENILSVAADGDRMPNKSTRFVPKPASGLVLRPLDII